MPDAPADEATAHEPLTLPAHQAPAEAGTTDEPAGAASEVDVRRGRAELPVARIPRRLVPVVVSVVLACASIAVALLLRTTGHPGDPHDYLRAALDFPHADWNAAGYSRYGIILPLLPFAKLWGFSLAAEWALPVLLTAWTSVSLYLLGRRLWGDAAGVAAAVLVVLNPVYFITTTRLYPDSTSVPLLVTAFWLVLLLGDERHHPSPRRGRITWVLLAIGFLIGWTWASRETTVVVWPVIVWMVLRRVPLRRALLPVALPALGWFGLELLLNQIGHHDAFARLKLLTGTYAAAPGEPTGPNFKDPSRKAYLEYVPHEWATRPELVWLIGLTVLAVLGAVLFARRLAWITAWTVITLGLALVSGGILRPDNVSMRLDIERYWIAWLLPMTLLAVGAVGEALAWWRRRREARVEAADGEPARGRGPGRGRGRGRWVAVTAAVFAVVLVAPVQAFVGWTGREGQLATNGERGMEELRTYLHGELQPGDKLWASSATVLMLDYYRRGTFGGPKVWSGKLTSLTAPGHGKPKPGDYVLYLPHETCNLCITGMSHWQPGKSKRTRGWTLVWHAQHGDVRVYQQQ